MSLSVFSLGKYDLLIPVVVHFHIGGTRLLFERAALPCHPAAVSADRASLGHVCQLLPWQTSPGILGFHAVRQNIAELSV